MSALRYFARNSVLRLFSFGVALIAAFMVTPHMLRCLGQTGYGVWALISSLAGYYMLLDFGLFQAVCKYTAAACATDDEEECARIYSTAFAAGALACVLTLALAGILSLCVGRIAADAANIPSTGAALGIFSASIAVQLLFRSSHAVLAAWLRWNTLALLNMMRAVFTTPLVLYLADPVLSVAENLLRVAVIMACGNLLEFGWHFCLALRGDRRILRPSAVSAATAKALLRYGAPAFVDTLGLLFRQRTQIFAVASFLGLSAVTLFSLAQQLLNYMNSVMLNAFGIMNPYFSRLQATDGMESCKKSLLEAMRLSFTVSTYMGLCAIFYGGLFLTRWLGPRFGETGDLLLPLGAASIITFGSGVVVGFLFGLGEHRILAALSISEGACSTLASIPAALLYGLNGVVWVMGVAALVMQLGILPLKVCRIAGIRLRVYHAACLGTVAVQAGVQGLYYLCIINRLTPDYMVIILACAGQFAVTALTLAITMRVSRGMRQEAASDAYS